MSALYKDQVEMGEFVLSTQDTPTKASDYSDLKKTADEINILRIGFLVIFIGLPLIAIVKTLRNVYRTRLKKLDSKANK